MKKVHGNIDIQPLNRIERIRNKMWGLERLRQLCQIATKALQKTRVTGATHKKAIKATIDINNKECFCGFKVLHMQVG